jgi:hypothetical protein
VTLLPAREADDFLARSRCASVPAWVTAVTGMRLDYVRRYERAGGQEMWLAVLTPQRGAHAAIYPVSLYKNLSDPRRRYWVGRSFAERYRDLLPFAANAGTETRLPSQRRCAYVDCGRSFVPKKDHPGYRFCTRRCFRQAYRGLRDFRPQPCAACLRDFLPIRRQALYCTERCRRDAASMRARRDATERVCVCGCGRTFSSKLSSRIYFGRGCATKVCERRRAAAMAATLPDITLAEAA